MFTGTILTLGRSAVRDVEHEPVVATTTIVDIIETSFEREGLLIRSERTTPVLDSWAPTTFGKFEAA